MSVTNVERDGDNGTNDERFFFFLQFRLAGAPELLYQAVQEDGEASEWDKRERKGKLWWRLLDDLKTRRQNEQEVEAEIEESVEEEEGSHRILHSKFLLVVRRNVLV